MKASTIRSLRAAEKRARLGKHPKPRPVAPSGKPFIAATRFRGLVRDLATFCEATSPALVANGLMRSERAPTLARAEALRTDLRRFLATLDVAEAEGTLWHVPPAMPTGGGRDE